MEDKINQWCAETGTTRGAVLTLEEVWSLSKHWYHNRMSPDFRGRSVAEAQALFASFGLTSDFWQRF